MTTDDSSGIALGLITFLVIVALYVWTSLALSAVFRKSGEQGWKGWVPILNQIVLLQLGRLSPLLFLLVLIPFVGPAIVWALLVVACYRINLSFGYGAGMTVLAALLLPVWASILGFGPARWLGADVGARGVAVGGPRRTSAPADDEAAYVPRATPPAYSPSVPFPAAPAGGWTPPPVPPTPPLPTAPATAAASASEPFRAAADTAPPASTPFAAPVIGRSTLEPPVPSGRWGEFDLGAVSEVTDEVTGAVSAAPAPVSAAPAPVSAVPVVPVDAAPMTAAPPVTRVPAAPAPEPAVEPWAPARSPMSEPDAFPETSGQVSAIVGAPDAGTPRSARSTVSAQHTKAEIPEDPIDETIITRRRRTAWSLVPPTGAPVPITADVVLIGRKPTPDREFAAAQLISIDDGTVSKTHARLSLRDDHWYVTDLGSTNGVLFATLMGTEVEATPGEEVEAGERFFLGDAEVRLQRSE
jgi:hypothetical protein